MTQPASALDRELAVEQAHVDLVYAQLAKAAASARRAANAGRAIYTSDRGTWAREEDGTAMFERDAFAFQAAKRLATLDAEHEGLVFGRLDLSDGDIRYIGRIGVRDEEYEPLVIDWRARAAEPFYRATPTDPMDVTRRRVLRCRNDRVIGIEDDLLDAAEAGDLVIIGEGALMAALQRARGPHMRDIVATIQAEQDEAIRADAHGVTVISGGPGTGKTVVALHRAAYLLYSNRRRFERGGILVVGPSSLFMNYIERVLPSLGEDSVTLRSIGAVASDVLGFSADRNDDATAATIKGSLRMAPLLKRLVDLPLVDAGPEGARLLLTVKGEPVGLDADQLRRIRDEVLARHKVNRAREHAERALLAALTAQVPDELELDADAIEDLITASAQWRMFVNAWWPALSPTEVLRRLDDPAVTRQVGVGLLDDAEQQVLSTSFAQQTWSVADIALLDELAYLLGPIPAEPDAEDPVFIEGGEVAELVTTADRLSRQVVDDPDEDAHDEFAHLLIDEAQDITPMQWRMLRRRGAHASWTIVGDPAQSSWPDVAESEQALAELIGHAPSRRFRLSVNYRSPAEVFALAARVVERAYPDADLPEAVRSTGVEPLLLATDAVAATVHEQARRLLADLPGSVGVIAPPSRLAAVTDALAGLDADRLVVVSPLQAKGLEYDGVIVVAPDDIVAESPGGVRVLYVALTRPTQRLVTVDPTPAGGDWRESLRWPATG
ncbi:HelD family protein [Micropruina sonneratiae]|uniref:HelD family protein n=1 Tax=Micropruina sonneratiae TaxID=2986940 RepID=UPI0022280E1A|nr:UvrD-helicase domain-containing protein [Micropruina sp. KQZ13P-5]MCW3156869.1 AAA family ATPase [Micropruina sp. KQZ13P-5]